MSNSKSAELKQERKILKDFNNLFEDESKYVRRRKMLANSFLLVAFIGIVTMSFVYYLDAKITWQSLVLATFSGLLLGFGLWFISFVNNWPVIRHYVDKEKLQERYRQIKN